MQAGDFIEDDKTSIAQLGAPSITSITKKKRQGHVGGPMTSEELRLNKGLLVEISNMKKMERDAYGSPGGSIHMERN